MQCGNISWTVTLILQAKRMFFNIYKITISTKLRNFQYWLLLDKIVMNKNLYQHKICNSDQCTLCKANRETIVHLMCCCPISVRFWEQVDKYILEIAVCKIHWTGKIITSYLTKFIHNPITSLIPCSYC